MSNMLGRLLHTGSEKDKTLEFQHLVGRTQSCLKISQRDENQVAPVAALELTVEDATNVGFYIRNWLELQSRGGLPKPEQELETPLEYDKEIGFISKEAKGLYQQILESVMTKKRRELKDAGNKFLLELEMLDKEVYISSNARNGIELTVTSLVYQLTEEVLKRNEDKWVYEGVKKLVEDIAQKRKEQSGK